MRNERIFFFSDKMKRENNRGEGITKVLSKLERDREKMIDHRRVSENF